MVFRESIHEKKEVLTDDNTPYLLLLRINRGDNLCANAGSCPLCFFFISFWAHHSTVTDLARFLGLSISQPFSFAT